MGLSSRCGERGAAGRARDELGRSRHDILRGSGLDPAVLDDPHAHVSADQELAVVRNLVATCAAGSAPAGAQPLRDPRLRDPGLLGLEAGTRYHATSYGIWGYAVTSCATVRQAVELALRYVELTHVFCIPELRTDGPLAELHCRTDDVPADVRSFLAARDVAAIATLVREQAAAELLPTAITLAAPAPPDPEPYRAVLGVVPEFGDTTRITFPHAVLDHPMPQANEHNLALCERQCREVLEARRRATATATLVRRVLTEQGPALGMAEVAATLSMTVRTLRRRLADEGVGFRSLVDRVRRERADQLLAGEAMTVEQVAQRLGYSEASSFIHAFTRWHGMSPREFRRRTGSARRPGGR
ncbi:AraC family transcriptional regulator [Saccharomonospora sp. CUA-673]|uniref:AraC family transcriptional regulator n=1 Tax=Saccharomonospora sp. CUA-673 TaxID=1904969 RepID=UPI002100F1D6|nr:AraC family transcriptional regulator [Saccharomonospora sp. CUA-673]